MTIPLNKPDILSNIATAKDIDALNGLRGYYTAFGAFSGDIRDACDVRAAELRKDALAIRRAKLQARINRGDKSHRTNAANYVAVHDILSRGPHGEA